MESSTCSRRSASRRARARARWLIFLPTRLPTRPVRARPHCLCPVCAPAAAGLQNSARAGHEERDFTTPHHVLRTRKPSLDARPNGSPNLSLVPDGPWAVLPYRCGAVACGLREDCSSRRGSWRRTSSPMPFPGSPRSLHCPAGRDRLSRALPAASGSSVCPSSDFWASTQAYAWMEVHYCMQVCPALERCLRASCCLSSSTF